MSNVPLVRRAIVGAAMANVNTSSPTQEIPIALEPQDTQLTPAALERASSTLKALSRMAKRPPVNIMFEDLSYTVGSHKEDLKILNSISGEFRSGELVCILGPSGAGKTTLLNVIAGYVSNGVSGKILINGHNRDMHVFKKLSTYIMQEDMLQPRLTLHESMRVAADLKVGSKLDASEKDLIIEEILQTLGLWEHRDTMSECLSGGQSKRLSIALELVNNPPVIFLDEPTTGLDVVAVRQLVVLLRLLSQQGRTVICTVHQPSASLFTLFDRVYVMARGMCCFQGAAQLVVPYLSELGHHCPTTHNPADFILETIVNEEDAPARFSELCQNGKFCRKMERISTRGGRVPVLHSDDSIQKIFVEHVAKEQLQKLEFPTTFLTQFLVLSKRIFLQEKRNKTKLWIQLIHHVLCANLVGSIFFGVGNDANLPIVNFKFVLCCVVFLMYTHVMVPVLLYPTEIKMLRREYFNRWYGLKAYYAAMTFSTIPIMVILSLIFLLIVYTMSGQLLEWDRFMLFALCGLFTAWCSEGLGLVFGSMFSVTDGCIVAPVTVSPLLMLCCYGMGFGPTIEDIMKVLMSISFLRYSVSAYSIALFTNRSPMDCNVDFCLYSDAKLILRDVGMEYDHYYGQMLGLIFFSVFHRTIAFLALRYKLTAEFSNKFMRYFSKLLNHR